MLCGLSLGLLGRLELFWGEAAGDGTLLEPRGCWCMLIQARDDVYCGLMGLAAAIAVVVMVFNQGCRDRT